MGIKQYVPSRARRPIRAYLYLLVSAVVLPLVALVAYHLHRDFVEAREAAAAAAVRLAQVSSAQAAQLVAEVRTDLVTLSRRPLVRALDPRRCDPLFTDFLDFSRRFATVLTIDLSGKPVCSPPRPQETATQASYDLGELVRTGKFTIGKPIIGPLTGKWVVVLAHPLHDDSGRLSGALGLPIDLANFHPLAGDVELPPGASIGIISSQGVVIARLRDPGKWVGRDARGIEIVETVLARKQGHARAAGADGVERIYGFAPVPETDWYAYAGIPASTAFAEARQRALESAAAGVLVALLAAALAMWTARALSGPVDAMAETARDIARGDWDARFEGEGFTEIVEIATEFNLALDALEEKARLLRESESRLSGILDTVMEGVISIDEQQRVVVFNREAERIFGRSAARMMGQPLGILVPERFRAQHEEHIRRFAATGQTNRPMGKYGLIYGLHADGAEFPIEATISQSGIAPDRLLTVVLRDVTERLRAEQALRGYAERLRQLSRRLFETGESERRRLARELHDRIGQNVTALNLNLNMLRGELPSDLLEKVGARLNDCDTLLFHTGQLVRDIMIDLRPPGLDELGLFAALNEHARQFSSRTGCSATVSGTAVMPRPPPATEITLFRIAQEALINIAKHAGATEVAVTLESGTDTVILTVADNGHGFDVAARLAQAGPSLGIVGMRERAESIGARLRVESAPGHGTRVIVEAPRAAPAGNG